MTNTETKGSGAPTSPHVSQKVDEILDNIPVHVRDMYCIGRQDNMLVIHRPQCVAIAAGAIQKVSVNDVTTEIGGPNLWVTLWNETLQTHTLILGAGVDA